MAGKKDSEKSGFGRRVYSVQSEGVIPIPSSAEFEAIMRGIPPGVGEYDSPRRGGKSKHCGVDIYSDKGASARAVVAGEGVVLFAGRMDSTAGNVVRVLGRDDRGDVVVTSYHHCERVLVKAGDVVQGYGSKVQPQVVATVGDSGNAHGTGPHVHFVFARGIQVSEGKEKTKKMSGEELGQLLNSLVGMSEDERRVRVAGLKFEGYVGMRDPETHMLAGNIGNPVVELEKISYLRNCSYYARKRMTV